MLFRLFLCACVLGFALPRDAAATLTICNTTEDKHSVAIGYKSGDTWISEGWWNITAGDCMQPVKGDLKQRYYYLRATSSSREFLDENIAFCTQKDAFTIRGDSDCSGRGYDKGLFVKIDTGTSAKNFYYNITDEISRTMPSAPGAATATLRSNLQPGVHGEPFSVSALLQECVFETEEAYCAFHAEGWKWFAYWDAATPGAMLEQIGDMPVNTSLMLVGDVIFYGDISVEIVLREVTPDASLDPYAHLRRHLTGMWSSTDDPLSKMYFSGSEVTEYYGEDYFGTQYLRIVEGCDNSPGGPGLVMTEPETQESHCLLIHSIDPNRMELTNPGRGNTLIYTRDY